MEAKMGQTKFGKIDKGMIVRLDFSAYPSQEYGSILGHLDYISPLPTDSGFLATIRLDQGLKKTKIVTFHINMDFMLQVRSLPKGQGC